MQTRTSTFATALVVACTAALSACGGSPTSAHAFAKACEASTNMDAAVCKCLGKAAEEKLTPEARGFLIASMEKDSEAMEQHRAQLSIEEAIEAGMFVTTNVVSCHAESS